MDQKEVGLIVGAFILGVLGGYFVLGSQNAEVNQLQAQVATLTSEKQALQSQVATLASEKQALQVDVLSLTADKDSLQARIAQLSFTIAQLNARIAALDSTVALLSKGQPSILALRFSPKGGAASQVSYWIGRANQSVHILIYSFTLDSIGDAVLTAYQRGVDVKIVFEKSQVSKYSEYFRLGAAGVQVRNDTNPDIMHNKVAIIDGYVMITGSFNWSDAAENDNNENLLVIRSAELATDFETEFQRIWTTGR